MQTPPQISFHGLDPSPVLRALIERRIARLERFHPAITTCRVVVEQPHHHKQQGRDFQVKIEVHVPGHEVIITHHDEGTHRDEDPHATVRDAFALAERRLADELRRVSGRVKQHEEPPQATILRVDPEEEYGFLATPDGREIYFHAHALAGVELADLEPGDAVTFTEGEGEEGPQATSVRLFHPG